jgi:hypothetical protein
MRRNKAESEKERLRKKAGQLRLTRRELKEAMREVLAFVDDAITELESKS